MNNKIKLTNTLASFQWPYVYCMYINRIFQIRELTKEQTNERTKKMNENKEDTADSNSFSLIMIVIDIQKSM